MDFGMESIVNIVLRVHICGMISGNVSHVQIIVKNVKISMLVLSVNLVFIAIPMVYALRFVGMGFVLNLIVMMVIIKIMMDVHLFVRLRKVLLVRVEHSVQKITVGELTFQSKKYLSN